jgi:uncharacterized protein YjlB
MNVYSTDTSRGHVLPVATLHTLTDDGIFPNNARLPLTVYQQAIPAGQADMAAQFETLFAAHHWPPMWRAGIFGFHHYHSTAHEVVGVFRGHATLQFGGEHGVVVEVQAGDAVILPAGVAHKSLQASRDFCAVGAYPVGQHWDTCTGKPGERPRTDDAITRVPLPQADPVYGPQGPLMTYWAATAHVPAGETV